MSTASLPVVAMSNTAGRPPSASSSSAARPGQHHPLAGLATAQNGTHAQPLPHSHLGPPSTGPSSHRLPVQPLSQGLPQGPSHDQPPQPVALSSQAPQDPQRPGPPAPKPGGFKSPTNTSESFEGLPAYKELSDLIKKTKPEIVRQVIRDSWERCLFGSNYHLAFIVNATFHQASPETLARALRDFGKNMVRTGKHSAIGHLTTRDLDDVSDDILAKASEGFMDKALARRLETIRARPLVNALARAERLGYDVRDIVEEARGGETVVPSAQPTPALSVPVKPVPSQPLPSRPGPVAAVTQSSISREPSVVSVGSTRTSGSPLPAGPAGYLGIVHCSRCKRPCSGEQAFRYHATRRACANTWKIDRVGTDICPHCGCIFSSSGGLNYHLKLKVCGDYSEAVTEAVTKELRTKNFPPVAHDVGRPTAIEAGPAAAPTPAVSRAPGPTPAPSSGAPYRHQAPTPGHLAAMAANGESPTTWSSPSTPMDDPYANLTPEQRREFESEMSRAEAKYGGLMKEAMKLPVEDRERELAKLKNSYNTKQSTTRKKYGIRLRQRRSVAEVEAERTRLLGSAKDLVWPTSTPSKRPHPGDGEPPAPHQGHDPHGGENTPRKRVPVNEMGGGLASAAATAEHTDPTAYLTASQPRFPTTSQTHRRSSSGTGAKGTSDDPMEIDDDDDGRSESSSSSDDDDIPAHPAGH